MNRFTIGFLGLIALLVAVGCSRQLPPSGGEKDENPPEVKTMTPLNGQVNFDAEKIEIRFDEYFKLNNVFKEIVISPPLDEPPSYNIKGKRLVVEDIQGLQPNTTYTINFGQSIIDITEGNKVQNLSYVFSTGSYIDSMQIQGVVLDGKTEQPVQDLLVALYSDLSDSALYKQKPNYFARTTKDGRYEIRYIKVDTYRVIAFKDANIDYLYNYPKEGVAFLDTFVVLDTARYTDYRLNYFEHTNALSGFKGMEQDRSAQALFLFEDTLNDYSVRVLSASPFDTILQIAKDTIAFWYDSDTFRLVDFEITNQDSIIDTISKTLRPTKLSKKSSKEKPKAPKVFSVSPFSDFEKLLEFPIVVLDTSTMELLVDTSETPVPFAVNISGTEKRKLIINADWQQGKFYQLKWKKGALVDYKQDSIDAQTIKFTITPKERFGNLALSIQTPTKDSTQYIADLKRGNQLIYSTAFYDSTQINLQNLKEGALQLFITVEQVEDGIWTSGDYELKRQPERFIKITDPIKVRGNWDVEVEISVP